MAMARRSKTKATKSTRRKPTAIKHHRSPASSDHSGHQSNRAIAQLRRELDEARQQQAATSKVLEVISGSAFDLNAVFETLAERSGRLCGADRANIFRLDGEVMRVAAAFNAPKRLLEWLEANPIRPGRHSVVARTALERRTIHVVDVLADPEHTYAAKAIRVLSDMPRRSDT